MLRKKKEKLNLEQKKEFRNCCDFEYEEDKATTQILQNYWTLHYINCNNTKTIESKHFIH